MNAEQWQARYEACIEASEHLDLSWTEDPHEEKQGQIVSRILRRMAINCLDKAIWLKENKPNLKPTRSSEVTK